jgi:hypothetical protein
MNDARPKFAETRALRGPRVFDARAVPFHENNKTVVREEIRSSIHGRWKTRSRRSTPRSLSRGRSCGATAARASESSGMSTCASKESGTSRSATTGTSSTPRPRRSRRARKGQPPLVPAADWALARVDLFFGRACPGGPNLMLRGTVRATNTACAAVTKPVDPAFSAARARASRCCAIRSKTSNGA